MPWWYFLERGLERAPRGTEQARRSWVILTLLLPSVPQVGDGGVAVGEDEARNLVARRTLAGEGQDVGVVPQGRRSRWGSRRRTGLVEVKGWRACSRPRRCTA